MASEETSSPLSPEQLLEEGKKALAAGNAAEAVDNLQEACGMLAEEHGQLAPQLAEPYFLYGKALLEVARCQNTVLGLGIPVPPEQADSSDDEDASSVNGDAPDTCTPNEAPGSAPSSSSNEASGSAPSSSTNEVSSNGDAPGPSSANEASGSNGEAPGVSSTNETPGNESEEEETDLKLAWEILELARVICQRQSGDDFKLKLADVQLVLAEVSLESDQSEQAIADLNSSLQIRQLLLDVSDRRLAEVYFSLGLAEALNKQPDISIKHFQNCKETLNKKLELLKTALAKSDLPEEKAKGIKDEISDINNLLPDVDSKISDTKDMKKMIEERESQSEEAGFPQVTSTEKPKEATDISHLMRKRAPVVEGGNEPKKPRTEVSAAGEANGAPTAKGTAAEQ